ncbi:MAG: hypothetical protein R2860_02230 [Desulfobacterales bacterium]
MSPYAVMTARKATGRKKIILTGLSRGCALDLVDPMAITVSSKKMASTLSAFLERHCGPGNDHQQVPWMKLPDSWPLPTITPPCGQ